MYKYYNISIISIIGLYIKIKNNKYINNRYTNRITNILYNFSKRKVIRSLIIKDI